jgi:hypothetical protein
MGARPIRIYAHYTNEFNELETLAAKTSLCQKLKPQQLIYSNKLYLNKKILFFIIKIFPYSAGYCLSE